MKRSEKISVLICSENNCGGETIVTKNLISNLIKKKQLRIKYFWAPALIKNNLPEFLIWQFKSVLKWMFIIYRQKSVDVIYTTTYTAGVAAAILKPFKKNTIYFHYHGNRIPPYNIKLKLIHNLNQKIKYYITLHLHIFFLRNCNLVIIPSELSAQNILKIIPSFPIKNLCVLHNGINIKIFTRKEKSESTAKKNLNINHKSKIILHIGRLNNQKGISELISVFKQINEVDKNTILLIAHPKIILQDEKKYKEVILNKINRLSLDKNVIWKVDHSNIPQLYHASELVVSLSKEENLPLIMLESFASGTIFISSNPHTKKLLNLVDKKLYLKSTNPKIIAKPILKILDYPTKKKSQITQKQVQLVKDFSISRMATRIQQLIVSH